MATAITAFTELKYKNPGATDGQQKIKATHPVDCSKAEFSNIDLRCFVANLCIFGVFLQA